MTLTKPGNQELKTNINSILAVIYLTKLQNLINHLVMNCSMNIFVYFYKIKIALA